ncbi:MAG: hypothetical protein P1V20_00950 [Verrucomicrobiales bacterium]|nr:hypothetical protein [Verrucomicrobiales bacterium]
METFIKEEQTSRGKRWVLPRRKFPNSLRYIPIVCWVVVAILIAGVGFRIVRHLLDDGSLFDLLQFLPPVLFAMFPLCFVGYWTSLAIFGETVVEADGSGFLVGEKVGPFLKMRRISFSRVSEISVIEPPGGVTTIFLDRGAIRLGDPDNGKTFAIGHSMRLLNTLSEGIKSELDPKIPILREVGELKRAAVKRQPVPISDQAILDMPFPDGFLIEDFVPEQSLRLVIQPKGFLKGSGGLGVFAVIWTSFISVFAVAIGYSSLVSNEIPGYVFLFLTPFIAVGIYLLRTAFRMGTNKITVIAGPDLEIREKWIGGSESTRYPKAALRAIRSGDSDMSVNDRRLKELKITVEGSAEKGVLRGLPEAQLRWLGAALRHCLRVPASLFDSDEHLPGYQPKVCLIEKRRTGVLVQVPKVGFFRTSGGLGTFSLVWLAIVSVFGFVIIHFSRTDQLPWFFLPILVVGIFGIIGLLMLFFAIERGHETVSIEVSRSTLKIDRRTPFRTQSQEVRLDDIAEISSVPSGETVNSREIYQLQVTLHSGPDIHLLKQLPEEELHWLAAELNSHIEN